MKFSIGIESISVNYEDEGKMLEEVEGYGEESINDNMFHLEIQDYNSVMESINAEVGILLKQSDSIVGTEADDTTDKKDPWYKRVWKAIKKMFETFRKWINRAYVWIGMKFGFGDSEDAATVSHSEIMTESEVLKETLDTLNLANGVKIEVPSSGDVPEINIEKKVEEVVKEVAKKINIKHIPEDNKVGNKVSPNSLNWIKPIVVKKVVEQIAPAAEVVDKGDEKVIVVQPDKISTYTFTVWLFEAKKDIDKIFEGSLTSNSKFKSMLNEARSNPNHYNVLGLTDLYLKLTATIMKNVGVCLNLLYKDIDLKYNPYGTIDEYHIKLSQTLDTRTINDLINNIKNMSKEISSLKSKSHELNLVEKSYEVKLINGKLPKKDYFSIVTDDQNYYTTKKIGEYITEASKLIPNYMDEIIKFFDNVKIEDIEHEKFKTAVTFMRESSVDLRTIASGLIGILGKTSMKKLRRTNTKMSEVSKLK